LGTRIITKLVGFAQNDRGDFEGLPYPCPTRNGHPAIQVAMSGNVSEVETLFDETAPDLAIGGGWCLSGGDC
jgi:hypothetical protein